MNRKEEVEYLKGMSNGELVSTLEDIGQRLAKQNNIDWAKRRDETMLSFRRLKNEIYRRLEGLEEYPPQ